MEQVHYSSLIWPMVNFLIFIGILLRIYRKNLRRLIAERSAQVAKHMQRSAEELRVADAELLVVRSRLASLDEEKALLLKELEEEGDRVAQRIVVEAKRSADNLEGDSARRIERDLDQAKREIKREIVELAAERAKQMLRERLSREDDRMLRRDALLALSTAEEDGERGLTRG